MSFTSPLQLLALACVARAASQSTDPFVGKWKFDASRSAVADEMSIAAAGANTFTVKFVGADPETIVADGQDHPGVSGTTLSITIEQPGKWKIVRKQAGRTLLTAIWTLGADGNTLADAFSQNQPDGSAVTMDLVYRRTAGRSGVPGTWESTSAMVSGTFELDIRPYATDGLSITKSDDQSTNNVTFDGNDHRRVGPNAFELTQRVKGKVALTERFTVSADRKTLTMTVQPIDQAKPNVLVFNRE